VADCIRLCGWLARHPDNGESMERRKFRHKVVTAQSRHRNI
jgi:hypothetical protein